MKEKIFKFFLEQESDINKDYNEYDYSFDESKSLKIFNIEFSKFIGMIDNFFYDGEKLVTSVNSNYIILDDNVLEHLTKLYFYANKHELQYEKNIIIEFLITYYNSLKKIKTEDGKTIGKYNEFKEYMKKNISKNFYNLFNDLCEKFYFEIVDYTVMNDIHIYKTIFRRIYNNLKKDKDILIDKLISDDKYLFYLYEYDNNLEKHYDLYINYIYKILEQEYEYQWIDKMIIKLSNNSLVKEEDLKNIINICVDKVNAFCKKYSNKDDSSLNFISILERTRKFLTSLLNVNLDKIYTKKLKECIINLLSFKRFIMKDEEYINKGMIDFSKKVEIDGLKCKEFVASLLENNYKLYSASSLDFDSEMFNCIELYSKYPLNSLGSRYRLDTKNQIYISDEDYNKSSNENVIFKNYYEKIAKAYVEKNRNRLVNIFGDNYYCELLKRLEETFPLHQSISLSILGKDNFYKIIDNLNQNMLHGYKDYISMIVTNILAIEININKCLTMIKKQYTDDMSYNLSILFEYFSNNNIARNGIMYLLYSLYEKTGPNLRNKAMHGTLFGNDLSFSLLISFSGLIFTNWLLSNGK